MGLALYTANPSMSLEYSDWIDCDEFGPQMWDDILSAIILIICIFITVTMGIVTWKQMAEQDHVNPIVRILFFVCIACATATELTLMAALATCPFSDRMVSVLLVSVAPFWYSFYMGILAILLVRVDIMFRGIFTVHCSYSAVHCSYSPQQCTLSMNQDQYTKSQNVLGGHGLSYSHSSLSIIGSPVPYSSGIQPMATSILKYTSIHST